MSKKFSFLHQCQESIVHFDEYKRSIFDSNLSYAHLNAIWDFYVTRSPSESSGLSISLKSYGWHDKTKELGNLLALETKLLDVAKISAEKCAIIRRKTIPKTLEKLQLKQEGCICCPRLAITQAYSVDISEDEELSYGSKESRMTCLFRHLRNSLAHGNTYLFDNDYIMLEDKSEKQISARILIERETLINWIFAVDSNELYYKKADLT